MDKSEIRISKFETISNDRNPKAQNGSRRCTATFGSFEHLNFGFVSDFGFRYSNLGFILLKCSPTGEVFSPISRMGY
ncbi:MAG: hypothetical protein A2Z25_04675 [Planctomycetes bacterium RBG_16_55_9]|nr:MAG: hypothetical protein A2Z25_04675 [Planctomycetes bacterium RBG_16_55_9]